MEGSAKIWHTLSAEESAATLRTDLDRGLAASEIEARQQEHGLNQLEVGKQKSALQRFLLQFHHPLLYILLAASALTYVFGEYIDGTVIFAVVLVNAVVSYLQETKAEKALESLRRSVVTGALVIRDGEQIRIPAEQIVPGDLVILQAGDKVPADLRLFAARNLRVNESMLTGESLPVAKQVDRLEAEAPLADRTNLAFSGTLVTHGQGRGAVYGTGMRTEVGKISQLLSETQSLETPLTRKMGAFSNWLLWVILGLSAITFAVGVFRGRGAFDMFMTAVALAVGAIPEGLPAALTITLAIGVGRMAKRRAIIRKLPAVEALGSTTVICSDKTGTLTENQMTVQWVAAAGKRYQVTGTGYAPEGKFLEQGTPVDPGRQPDLMACLTAGLLCNEAQLKQDPGGRWAVEGDPTEGALVVSARKAGLSAKALEDRLPRLDVIPFESETQFMATLHRKEKGAVIFAKGSLEALLPRCGEAALSDGGKTGLDREAIMRTASEFASLGLRVLAFASKELPAGQAGLEPADIQGMTFLGLQAMIDPPRQAVKNSIAVCRSAGIGVKMITGDSPGTALAIAQQLGLEGSASAQEVVTGQDLERMSEAALADASGRASIFARVAPEQKLKLVHALQQRGHTVAMTGDGVNDSPALRAADIGIAMGITGTEAAKEASDMVLLDDNFTTIEAAVEEGRGVFDNIVKFIVWTLPTNLGEGLVILVAIFAGTVLPILPVQILWINMTTAILLGMMLAFEPKETGLMARKPRKLDQPILTAPLLLRLLIVGLLMLAAAYGLFMWRLGAGASESEARTLAVNVIVMIETFYLFNCRSFTQPIFKLGFLSNPWVILGVVAMLLAQIAYTYVPFMNRFFHSAPITGWDWLVLAAIGLFVSLVVMVEKIFLGKRYIET